MQRRAPRVETIVTEDGSPTLRLIESGIEYRSRFGARRESELVFLAGTRLGERRGSWEVLEIGFGGGANFAATCEAAREAGVDSVSYYAVERAPVRPRDLAHLEGEAGRIAREALAALEGDASAREARAERGRIALTIAASDWREADLGAVRADAIFHDPFGPKIDPESWTREAFSWSRARAAPWCVLATYGAAGRARRAMARAGWWVSSRPGPPPKREVTSAALDRSRLDGWRILRLERGA